MEAINWLLVYIYSLANLLGKFLLDVLNLIFNFSNYPVKLIDPIGFLMILTIFFVVVIYARRIAKWILIVSWIFIAFRIAIVIYQS